ncbi:aldehyde ferredoxin oxidoreductase family protein [Salarchaeum sp. JOR-1]|uniref:aldehyde ferredoxin oxidoreductase family protein n=1 Tax=Salarchaeum sp. JOR-1 TaxID=2599399 RepID=UPI001198A20B|nr:aldehyde ferredoxin oxidoreductase C-terminal domain-containing protein [Salarchaeum sp. JOR-1]QDX41404.1 aldehyde ferredoxin oxidoreductase [Salarchaeum sp. JOR-1]
MAWTPPTRALRVALDERRIESEPIPDDWLDAYRGGKGLGARYLHANVPRNADALGPENALVFALGPLSAVTADGRYAAVTKSPLTGTFLDSYAGGTFPQRLAGSLGDHLVVVVTGRASEPTALVVENGDARLEPATALAGADAVEAADAYPDAAVACVGPAGENEVAYATIASDGGDHHAGRGGAGAVMGSKNLKAVVARDPAPDAPDRSALVDDAFAESDVGRWQAASETLETVDFANEIGALPTRGWQEGTFAGADDIGIEAARDAAVERERDGARPGGFRVESAEGETVPRGSTPISLGAGLGIDDFDAVAALGALCDRLGVDVITAGNAVAFAARASADGHVDRDVDFGDADAARALIREVAGRETALGDALADGVAAAAEELGAAEHVPTVKAMELPAYDPRAAPAMALAYATSDRGACHRRARPIEQSAVAGDWTDDQRVDAVIEEQNRRSALWSLGLDDFVGEAFDDVGASLLAAVGVDATPADLRLLGERVWNLVRLFNVREGFDRADDSLPAVLTTPLPDGPAAGASVDADRFESLLETYYDRRGWDDHGRPTPATRDRLGLTDL